MLKLKLNEAVKSIDDEYLNDWSQIDRNIFDQIIALDPKTDLNNSRLGPNAKQFLLPIYLKTKEDFLSFGQDVKDCLEIYLNSRKNYPSELRNIANFPSVRTFVDFVKNPEGTKVEISQTEKEDKIDKIYKEYYQKNIPDKDLFIKLIQADPSTNIEKGVIGALAKNLILRLYVAGDDTVLSYIDPQNNLNNDYIEGLDYYNENKGIDLTKIKSMKEFVELGITFEDSSWLTHLKSITDYWPQMGYVGSTAQYDVFVPQNYVAAAYIAGAEENIATMFGRQSGESMGPGISASWGSNHFNSNAIGHWCTTNSTYWPNYRNHGERYYDFIHKVNTISNDRHYNFQAAVRRDGSLRMVCDGKEMDVTDKQLSDLFSIDPTLANLLSKEDEYAANIPFVKHYSFLKQESKKPFIYTGKASDFNEIKTLLDNDTSLINLYKNSIKKVEIAEGVEIIPVGYFAGWRSLKEVKFPSTLKTISVQAFKNCSELGLISLNEGLEQIGSQAFANCVKLHGSVVIPNSVTKIGRQAFLKTDVTLSLKSTRPLHSLHIELEDEQWMANNSKYLDMSKVKEEYELDEEFAINENIPRELARAYQNAIHRAERADSSPSEFSRKSNHITQVPRSSNLLRRRIPIDYANSTYRKVSYEEAKEYLGIGSKSVSQIAEKLPNLRLIIHGELVEWENRNGKIYYLYWTEIPWATLEDVGSQGFRGKNGFTNDTKFALKASDIDICLQCADSIYITDEYEHFISDDSDIAAKRRKNSEEHNLYFIPDPETRNTWGENNWLNNDRMVKTMRKSYYQMDTGSHDKGSTLRYKTEYGSLVGSLQREYVNTLESLRKIKKVLSLKNKALNNLLKNEDLYSNDTERFNEIKNKLKADIKDSLQAYKQNYDAAFKLKTKMFATWNQKINEANDHLKDAVINLRNLIKLRTELSEKYRSLQNDLNKNLNSTILDDRDYKREIAELDSIQRSIDSQNEALVSIRQDIEEKREKIHRMEQEIQELENDVQVRTEKIEEFNQQLEEAEKTKNEVAEKYAIKSADEYDKLKTELTEVADKMFELFKKTHPEQSINIKNKQMDELIKQMLVIGNEIIEDMPESEENSDSDASND